MPLVGGGDVGAALLEQHIDGLFFTGCTPPACASRRPWRRGWSSCSSNSAARTRATCAPTPMRRSPPRAWPMARCTTPARAAARSNASTCTTMCTTPSSSTSWPAVRGMRDRRPDARRHLHRRDHPRAAARRARRSRWPTRRPRARRCCAAASGCPGRATATQPTVFTDVNHDMVLMREESFGPLIGIQKVRSDDEALALMNDTRYGLTAGVYTPDEARVARAAGAGQRRQRLLELLRPRQPAPAVVRAWRFGRRPDACRTTASRPSRGRRPGTCARPEPPSPMRLTLFDLDHTLLNGDTDELWCAS